MIRLWKVVHIAVCLISFAAADAAAQNYRITASEKKTGRTLLSVEMNGNDRIELRTIHSVSLRPYSHIFKVDGDENIILDQAIYDSAGGGYPVLGDGTFRFENNKFIMENMNRFIGVLYLRVSPVSKETLIVSGTAYPIYSEIPEGSLIVIRAHRIRR